MPVPQSLLTAIQTMEQGRKPPPQMNPFRPFVTNELKRRKRNPSYTSTPFVRMVSCLEAPGPSHTVSTPDGRCTPEPTVIYKYFTLGLHGYEAGGNIFDITYGSREVVGYAYANGHQIRIDTSQLPATNYRQLADEGVISQGQANELTSSMAYMQEVQSQRNTPAGGAHPMPGITNVRIERFTDGAGIRAIVSWNCYNRQQLEFLRHHFMMAGSHVVLEWGHEFANKRITKRLNYRDDNITTELANSITIGRKFTISQYVLPNDGNYDFLVGAIANFTVGYDAPTNTYNCTTTIVTSGEYLWGLNVPQTFMNPGADENSTPESTFEEYFKEGGLFDNILGTYGNSSNAEGRGKVSTMVNAPSEGDAPANTNIENMSKNAKDYQFITWKFFAGTVLRDMCQIFENTLVEFPESGLPPQLVVAKEISSFLKFIDATSDADAEEDKKPWIGNNTNLRSTDPEIMILIKSNMANIPADLVNGGTFDDGAGQAQDRGLLANGVWLNAGMIRRCFLESMTFEQAMRSILIAMNASVLNYWNLRILYDENIAGYVIVDEKYNSLDPTKLISAGQKIYKFNFDTRGECLEISLDSSYPPEIVTQLALVARLRDTPGQFLENLKKYPMFATTAHFAMAMNWTNYKDLVSVEVQRRRQAEAVPIEIPQSATGPVSQETVTSPSNQQRVTGQPQRSTSTTGNHPAPGESPNNSPSVITPTRNGPPLAPEMTNRSTTTTVPARGTPANNSTLGGSSEYGNQPPEAMYGGGGNITVANGVAVTPTLYRAISRTISLAEQRRVAFRITSGYRSQEEQDALRERWFRNEREHPGLNRQLNQYQPAATSPHKMGNAIDAVPNRGTSLAALKKVMEDSGWTWQGRNDPVHWNYHGPDRENVADAGQRYSQNQMQSPSAAPMSLPPTTDRDFQPGSVGVALSPGGGSSLTSTGGRNADGLTAEEQTALAATQRDIIWKFGDQIASLVEPNQTRLRNIIMKDGMDRHGQNVTNGFIAPIPTTAKIDIGFQGVSGISIFDVFSVDKLPYMYEQFGIFHVTQINDNISREGWKTQLHGVFRFLYFDPSKSELALLSKMTY